VPGWNRTVRLDLFDRDGCRAVLREAKPDAVIHLAAAAAVGASFSDPERVWRTNLLGTLGLGEAVREACPEALFVHASSAEVYGLSFREGRPLAEDAPLRPANPYAASKAAADLAIGEMTLRGLRAIRLRPFNHTGPGQSGDFVVASFARQVAAIAAGHAEPVIRVGEIDRWRDFLDVADVCDGYVAALRHGAAIEPGAVFNLASGEPRHVGTILSRLLELAGVTAEIVREPGRLRPTDIQRTVGDATAARRVFGWSPKTSWETTLSRVLSDWARRV